MERCSEKERRLFKMNENIALRDSFTGFLNSRTLEEAMRYKRISRENLKNWKEAYDD